MVTVRDFTKFRIPPPLSFELEKISRIFPYPGAENLIHLLVFPTYSPGWPGVLPLGEADDMCIMADETPKKVVEDSSRCFTCPSLSADNNRVFIFGKSDHSFADIIKTSLNVDVNCYANSKLFICKNACYNRLLKVSAGIGKARKNQKRN